MVHLSTFWFLRSERIQPAKLSDTRNEREHVHTYERWKKEKVRTNGFNGFDEYSITTRSKAIDCTRNNKIHLRKIIIYDGETAVFLYTRISF